MTYNQFTKKHNVGIKKAKSFLLFLKEVDSMLADLAVANKAPSSLVSLSLMDAILKEMSFNYIILDLSAGFDSGDYKADLNDQTIEKIKDNVLSLSKIYIDIKEKKVSDDDMFVLDEKSRVIYLQFIHSVLSEFHFTLNIGLYPSTIGDSYE